MWASTRGAGCSLLVGCLLVMMDRGLGETTINILGGQYKATTDVQSELNLALDIAEMREVQDGTGAADEERQREIYSGGEHSFITDETGKEKLRSLASLSLDAEQAMDQDFLYNIYVRSFYHMGVNVEEETPGDFDDKPVSQYANTIVNDLFALDLPGIETQAALVLNVWMAVAHELWQMLSACGRNDANTATDMSSSLDRAAALWIGEGQVRGDAERGQLLYNLAQKAGARFNKADGSPVNEVEANQFIVASMKQIQTEIAGNKCATGERGYLDVRKLVLDIYSYMTVPLIHQLIHHIRSQSSTDDTDERDFIELYALAVMPQIAFCDPLAHDEMVELFITGTLDPNDRDRAIELVQSTYGCMHVTCEMIGSYLQGEVDQCSDASPQTPKKYAGYAPTHDAVEYAYLDRDVTLFRVLLEEQAYDAATELYKYGYNSRPSSDLLSLQRLATFPGRNLVPQMEIFNNYFDVTGENGFTYADNFVMKALKREGRYEQLSKFILTEIAVGAVQYMVLWMAVLQKVYIGLDHCKENKAQQGLKEWDQAVALFVGSMEGEEAGGSEQGYGEFLYGAGKFFCDVFDTCVDDTDDSKLNIDVMQAFEDGRASLQQDSCDDLGVIVSFIQQDLIVPLIQGTLHYSVLNEPLTDSAQDATLGAGHILGQSVIPLVEAVDANSATTIDANTNVFLGIGSAVPAEVFNAFRTAIVAGLDVDCDVVGIYVNFPDGNVCDGDVTNSVPEVPGVPNPEVPKETPPPAPSGEEQLGFGRYQFGSPHNPLAKLALDVRDMVGSNAEDALKIYSEGKYAVVDNDGESGVLSLADFSTGAKDIMSQDPMYNIFRFALQDEDMFETQRAAITDSEYADITVRAALEEGLVPLAADAAVALNAWMKVANSLHQAVRDCREGVTDTFRIDNAVALWIGESQFEASESGWLLYAKTQSAASRFRKLETEAPVNTKLMTKFSSASTLMKTCSATSDTYLELRGLVQDMLSDMTIPLFEELLYQLTTSNGNGNYVKLYSLSVVPQVAACDPAAFTYLKGVLIDDDYDSFDSTKLDSVLQNLKPLLTCLRRTCDDLQVPKDDATGLYAEPFDLLCDDDDGTPRAIAGYTPSSDTYEYTRIDLDVLAIGIFMETNALDAAIDVYVNGYNSKPGGNFLSIQNLATDPGRAAVPVQFRLFTEFFGTSETYADEMITDAINNSGGEFQGASRLQMTELVVGTIKTMVSYMAVLQRLFIAGDECEGGAGDSALSSWDAAVALFVGSIEGQERGGNMGGGGQLLHSLGVEMCEQFSTCELSGSAAVNERLIDTFTSGKGFLEQGDCANVETLITMNVLPVMPIPMIQGTLEYASVNEALKAGSKSVSLAAGHVYAFSVLPLVDDANSQSAQVIGRNLDFQLIDQPVADGAGAVYEAFASALSGMAVNCADIGTDVDFPDQSVCQGDNGTPPKPKPPSTPTHLSEGLYTTTTNVQDRANIALDVMEMEKHLLNGNVNVAKFIYTTGSNSQISNDNGVITGQRSLSGFSTTAPREMIKEPLFNIFRYALQDSRGEYLGKDVGLYADSIVLEAFANIKPASKTLASEATVVLTVWMYVVHELFQTLDRCSKQQIADEDGIHSIDEVAAYWIGDGQQTGSADNGHLLYALTEKHGDLFGLDENGQSRTNTKILSFLNQAKLELTSPNACTDDPKTFPRLLHIVNKLVPQMAVPLIQGLIHNLKQNDRDRVKLYAQSFVPMVSATDPDRFAFLSDKLIALNYNAVEIGTIMEAVFATLPGFGLTCADIGTYAAEDSVPCVDPLELNPLAGYRPETNVQQYANLDRDILELDILMKMQANAAAKDLYMYGKHSVHGDSTLSLHELATSSDRLIVPTFASFERYFNDERYADTTVQRALDTSDSSVPTEERRFIVTRACQYMVVHMGALSALYETLTDCRSSRRSTHSVADWDKAAALLIGSLEGSSDGGSDQGLLHHGLAKKRCTDFGTCTRDPRNAEVNERVIELLYAGRAEITAKSCNTLERNIGSIESLLLVPLIQSTLWAASANSNTHVFSRDSTLGESFVFSRSILPLVQDANRASAAVLEKNMDLSATEKERNDAAAVFDALAEAYANLGVDCTLVGSTSNGVSACSGSEGMDSEGGGGGASAGAIAGAVIGIIAAIGLGVFGFKYYKKHKLEKAASETTSLVTNELGVLDVGSQGLEHNPRVSVVDRSPENVSFVRNKDGLLNHGEDDGSPEQVSRRSRGLDEPFEDIKPPYGEDKDGLV